VFQLRRKMPCQLVSCQAGSYRRATAKIKWRFLHESTELGRKLARASVIMALVRKDALRLRLKAFLWGRGIGARNPHSAGAGQTRGGFMD
jgi:hypothetical protein